MASQPTQPLDCSDSGSQPHGGSGTQSAQGLSHSVICSTISDLQRLDVSSRDPYIRQELREILEKYGKAIVSQGMKTDRFVEMIEQVLALYRKSEDIRQNQEEQLKKLVEDIHLKQITIQQLQATVSAQEAEITHLQMDVSQLKKISYNGVLLVEIKDYMRKKNQARSGPTSFYTDEFFTDRYGYKMCARIYLNGDGVGKGTHLSIFFAIKKGDHDNYLKWPFQRRVTFTLVNQDGKDDLSDAFRPDATSSSFQRPRSQMNIASGCPMFVSHEVLENPRGGYLKNNTICLKVTVDPPTR